MIPLKKLSSLLPSGKLDPDLLERHVLDHRGAERDEVLIGPRVGEDAAVIAWPAGDFLVASSDPIVGATAGAGRLLVQVNANDIVAKGGQPCYLIVTLILPSSQGEREASALMAEIGEACREIGVAVVGGHTEFTPRYDRPVLVGTMFGRASRVLRAEAMRPGDVLIMTKHAGIEGMAILAQDRPDLVLPVVGPEALEEIQGWTAHLSVLPEGTALRDLAVFMHDPTEGGLLGGFGEISRLASLGLHLDRGAVPVHPHTARLAEALGFDPLRLISSGVLLAVLAADRLAEARRRLDGASIAWSAVGSVVEGSGDCPPSLDEELWRLLELEQ
ncbi:MAG: hydrogenase expression protein [Synergistaceae bacterium]|nr:hydrogenase expression protein [Synergistaceae bacterium]